jgi:hypothetical protein
MFSEATGIGRKKETPQKEGVSSAIGFLIASQR